MMKERCRWDGKDGGWGAGTCVLSVTASDGWIDGSMSAMDVEVDGVAITADR